MIQKSRLSNYDRVKLQVDNKASEKYFTIDPQPKNTCPLINDALYLIESVDFKTQKDQIESSNDEIVKSLKSVITSLSRSEVSDNPDVLSALRDLDSIVDDVNRVIDEVDWDFDSNKIVNRMEEVRTNCENIRNWGQGWKDLYWEVFNSPFLLFRQLFRLWFAGMTKTKKSDLQISKAT